MNEIQRAYWQRCRSQIEAKLGWGQSQTWQSKDFDVLGERIFEQTQVRLSASTLRRLWGRVQYDHLPAATTLNILAQFVGYADWRTFCQTVDQDGSLSAELVQPIMKRSDRQAFSLRAFVWLSGSLLVLVLLGAGILFTRSHMREEVRYQFGSRPVTRGIPNSVIFTYDARVADTDCVFIQQSWDPARRQRVLKERHEFTSIYYYPGSYQARLVVGSQVVKKHSLIIATKGWLGLIDKSPVPIYLDEEAITEKGILQIQPKLITAQGVLLKPTPPTIQFYNVGTFKPVSTNNFTFSCKVRNEGGQGTGVCQHTVIGLFTEDKIISVPLCREGCVSAITLVGPDTLISGKTADLSAFGTRFDNWVHVRCTGDRKQLRFYVNEKLAYTLRTPSRISRIVGLAYGFEGPGSVREIRLLEDGESVFQAF